MRATRESPDGKILQGLVETPRMMGSVWMEARAERALDSVIEALNVYDDLLAERNRLSEILLAWYIVLDLERGVLTEVFDAEWVEYMMFRTTQAVAVILERKTKRYTRGGDR